MIRTTILFLYISFCVKGSFTFIPKYPKPPKLLVVSYDGFRYDYFDRNLTFLSNLKTSGTYADYMINVFVTKTLPNHHTISTGDYVESHGVVDSKYRDEKGKIIKYSDEFYHYDNKIMPIWTVNEIAGKARHSGTMMWPGSDFEYQGINSTFAIPWDIKVPWGKRVDDLIKWFKDPEKSINFGMLYIEEPDFHGHGVGINHPQFNEVLLQLDNLTFYLHQKLKDNDLEDVNVIHLSDHGMVNVKNSTIIDFTKYLNSSDYSFVGESPVISIYPIDIAKTELVYNSLKKAAEETKTFDVYYRKDVPEKYHYSHNPRIGPIIIVAHKGYAFQTLRNSFEWYQKEFNITIDENSEFGTHGFYNEIHEMHPFFFGVGPAFLASCKVEPFENVDLFPLFCDILNLNTCPRVNGTLKNLKKCLTKYKHSDEYDEDEEYIPLYKGIYFAGIVISVLGLIILYMIHRRIKKRQKNSMYRVEES